LQGGIYSELHSQIPACTTEHQLLILRPMNANNKTQVAQAAHNIGKMEAVVYADAEVNDAVVGVAFVKGSMLDITALLGNTRGEGGDNTALGFHFYPHVHQKFTGNIGCPVYVAYFFRVVANFGNVVAAFLMDNQPLARADMTHYRVAGYGPAAAGK